MKSIISTALPNAGTLLVAGLIFTCISFRDPFARDQKKSIQLKDSIPGTELNISVDV